MVVKLKIKQVRETEIDKLSLMANMDGNIIDKDVAKFIISVSPYWRTKGYSEILKAINENDIV